jgi:hypothetical protein
MQLCIFENRLKNGRYSEEEFEKGIELCKAIFFNSIEVDDQTFNQAARLLEEYGPEDALS